MDNLKRKIMIIIPAITIFLIITFIFGFGPGKDLLFPPEMPTYTGVSYESLTLKVINNKEYYVNENDEIVISMNDYKSDVVNRSWYGYINAGYILIEYKGRQGVIDTECNVIIEPKYDEACLRFLNGKVSFYIKEDNRVMFLDENLELQKDNYYDDISDSLILGVNTLWGNDKEYEYLKSTIYYNYLVEKDGLWGLCDIYGNIIIPTEYQDIWFFGLNDNLLRVEKDGLYGIVDENNQVVLPIEYKDINYLRMLDTDNKYGCLNEDGTVLIEPQYDSVAMQDDFIFAEKDGLWGIVDYQNNILVDFNYDHIGFCNPNDVQVPSLYLEKNGTKTIITEDSILQ